MNTDSTYWLSTINALLKLMLSFVLMIFSFQFKSNSINATTLTSASINAIYVEEGVASIPMSTTQPSTTFQFITHGRPGELFIQGAWRDADEIAVFIKPFLQGKTQLNIYGCEFAKGRKGLAALHFLEQELGVPIAASTNLTGKDGDWVLEAGSAKNVLNFPDYAYNLQCPTLSGSVFKKTDDVIISTYHSHIAKVDGGYVTWGEDMAANGGNALVMTPINSTNGYNYTGDVLMFCVSGNSDAQAFLLTTTGMYSWGSTGEVVGGSIVSSNAFSSMTMPTGVAPSDVLEMKASSDIFYMLTNTGEVWVVGRIATQVSGNSADGANTWHQVETSSNVPLTGVIEITGTREVAYARRNDGSIVAWGRGVALGNGTSAVNRTYASPVDVSNLPNGVTLSQLGTYMDNSANSSGIMAVGSDGKVYGMGYSGEERMLNQSSNFVSDWITIKGSDGNDMADIVFLATSENSEEYAGAGIIKEIPNATNDLYTWGYSDLSAIGHSTAFVEYPTIPSTFNQGSDNPVYVWVGGHATSYLNDAGDGSICFTGHITSGSGGGLQTAATGFSCFGTDHPNWPTGVVLCNQIACGLDDPGTLTGTCTNENDLTFTLNLIGVGFGTSYNVSGANPTTGNTYATDVIFTIPNGADSSNKTITVTDMNDSGCSLTITILGAVACPSNTAPVAVNDIDTTLYETDSLYFVLQNDSDVDGHTLNITGVGTDGATDNGGIVSINNNGTAGDTTDDFINYSPPSAFTGNDTFQYTISDGNGGVASAMVTFYVRPPKETNCSNGIDEDGDGLIDCVDSDCLPDRPAGILKN